MAVAIASPFAWRAPLTTRWAQDWAALDAAIRAQHSSKKQITDTEQLCGEIRALATQRLGPHEQMKLEGLARRLMGLGDQLPALRKMSIGLLGNHTLSFLVNPLRAAGLARNLLVDAIEAPYNSAALAAFGDANLFSGATLDSVVAVLDLEAFAASRELLNQETEDAAVAQAEHFLRRLAASLRRDTTASFILATIPFIAPAISSSDIALTGSDARLAMRINGLIMDGAKLGLWHVWDLASLAARVGFDNWYDPESFHLAKVPFRIELCPLVADHLCRILGAMAGKSCRALVVDLDNTLWGGIVGDDGWEGIRLGQGSTDGEAYLAFQRFILELHRRGVVLAVSSKNSEEIAREPFRLHPEMILKETHFSVFQANWDDKASNILAIAKALNLGLESVAFADDNPAERERVRQSLPQVTVPELGEDPAHFAARLSDSGAFEHLLLNRDDLARAKSYDSNAQRAELRASAGNYDEYLTSLKMRLTVNRFDEAGNARITQLINKSNQFNLTTRRYNSEDVRKFAGDSEGILCWQVQLEDAFANHGMIGIVIVRKSAETWTIDSWLQSCRVLSRGVEQSLANLLLAQARQAGAKRVVGEYVPSARNAMVGDFYARLGFAALGAGDRGATLFECCCDSFKPLTTFIQVDFRDGPPTGKQQLDPPRQ